MKTLFNKRVSMNFKYIYKREGSIYFRKKINNNEIYRSSLKKLLGKKLYYKLLSKSSMNGFIEFLNNSINDFIAQQDRSLNDVTEFVKNLLKKYRETVLVNETENDFLDNFGSVKSQIEEERFKALDYYTEDGSRISGHTIQALERERALLVHAYDSNNISNLTEAVNKILTRQNIITREELDQIPDNLRKSFFEALIKVELQVLDNDIKNYQRNTAYSTPVSDQNSGYSSFSDRKNKTLLDAIEQQFFINKNINIDLIDYWDQLIADYTISRETEGISKANIRKILPDLYQFRDIMLGNEAYGIKRKYIRDMNDINDLVEIKELFMYIPNLNFGKIKTIKNKGTLFLIVYAKDALKKAHENNKPVEDYGVKMLAIGGLTTKLKTVKYFLKFLESNKMYKNKINFDMWDKLTITEKSLPVELKKENSKKVEIPMKSVYLNNFLKQKYQNDAQGIKNFKVHTGSSPHIFWSFVLAIFTGARPEELAQLKLKDFYRMKIGNEYYYYFKIRVTDFEEQSVKTKNSIRTVPLHKSIIELGFLNYFKRRMKLKSDWLFSLNKDSDGKRKEFTKSFTSNFKKWFVANYPEEIGVIPTFYDLRSHFMTKFLQNTDIDTRYTRTNLKKLVGHATGYTNGKDVTDDNYFKEGLELQSAYEMVMSIDFKINEGYAALKEFVDNKEYFPEEVLLDLKLVNDTITLDT